MPDHDTPDLDALEAMERAATPGPWLSWRDEGCIFEPVGQECADRDLSVAARNALPALLRAARERDELRAVNDRLMEERRAILLVKTTDGLTASEWILRTGLAKARAEKAEADLAESKRLVEKAEARVKELAARCEAYAAMALLAADGLDALQSKKETR